MGADTPLHSTPQTRRRACNGHAPVGLAAVQILFAAGDGGACVGGQARPGSAASSLSVSGAREGAIQTDSIGWRRGEGCGAAGRHARTASVEGAGSCGDLRPAALPLAGIAAALEQRSFCAGPPATAVCVRC